MHQELGISSFGPGRSLQRLHSGHSGSGLMAIHCTMCLAHGGHNIKGPAWQGQDAGPLRFVHIAMQCELSLQKHFWVGSALEIVISGSVFVVCQSARSPAGLG